MRHWPSPRTIPAFLVMESHRLGLKLGHTADVRANRATSQPSHHLGSPELAARQPQQAGQGTSHGGVGQRFLVRPGDGDAGQTQLVPYQRGVGIIHTVENRHPVEGGSLLPCLLSYAPNHPPQLLVSVRRDVQRRLPGQQRQRWAAIADHLGVSQQGSQRTGQHLSWSVRFRVAGGPQQYGATVLPRQRLDEPRLGRSGVVGKVEYDQTQIRQAGGRAPAH